MLMVGKILSHLSLLWCILRFSLYLIIKKTMSTQKENKGLQSNVFFQWQHKGLGLGENALKAVSDPCCPQTDN